MPIWGIDISGWQAGINLDQVAREGFAAVIAKATEGAGYTSPEYRAQKAAARRAGLRFCAYHYVRAGDSAAAQADRFESVEPDRAVPVMLDHEMNSGSADVLRAVHAEFVRRGYRVVLIYLPRWYWRDHIGSPDLRGLPPLMASSYGTDLAGFASALYPGDGAAGWGGYGGNKVAVLQFTQRARVAGREIDAWAFQGTLAQLDALFGAETEFDMAGEAEAVALQMLGPNARGFMDLLGRAVETDPDRGRFLTEAIAVILVQLCGDPNYGGWTQLGDGPDSDAPKRTLVDGIAHVMQQNREILALLKAAK